MTDLRDRIRDFIDSGAAPVSVEEIVNGRSAARVNVSVDRARPRLRRVLVLTGVVALALTLVTVGLVNVPGAKNAGVATVPASAASFLKKAADKAAIEKALVPGPGQYLYVSTIEAMGNGAGQRPSPKPFWYDSDQLHQVWTSPRAPGHQTFEIVGRPEFLSAADRAIWVIDGSPPLGSGSSSGPTPPYYNITGLPTKASEMLAYFKTQIYLPAESTYGSVPSWEFDVALGFLQSGASSTQQAALLRFIATIPGVRLRGHATSIVTRERGSVIELPLRGYGRTEEAIFDPSSSKLIETRIIMTALPAKAMPFGPPAFVGEILSYTDFLYAGITRVNSKYSLPAGTPKFLPVWPFGALREPLPGWLASVST